MLSPLPYLKADRDRHGNVRYYVRVKGRKIRLREPPGTPAFLAAYQAGIDLLTSGGGLPASSERHPTQPGSLRWLAEQYFASAHFRAFDLRSRTLRQTIIECCLAEPAKPGAPETFADCPMDRLSAKLVRILIARRADKPGAANNRLKYLSAMLTWGTKHADLKANVALGVEALEYASDGYHTWHQDEIRQFEARHPVGTKPRLAMALLLYTGLRSCDVVALGPQHIRAGWLKFKPRKTAKSSGVEVEIPILAELADVIAASPCEHLTFLTTAYGRPHSERAFGSWFKAHCRAAGLPHCSPHGLRKAGATILAERGASDRQLMAIYGWTSSSQASAYVKKAERRKMAGEAMHLLKREQTESESGPPAQKASGPPLLNH